MLDVVVENLGPDAEEVPMPKTAANHWVLYTLFLSAGEVMIYSQAQTIELRKVQLN